MALPEKCKCGSPLKNDRCPSCGWNPTAPKLGVSEAQLAQKSEAARLRALLAEEPAAAPAAAAESGTPDPLIGYLVGMGYSKAAAASILEKNRASVQLSFDKAGETTETVLNADETSGALPTMARPPATVGW